MRSLGGQLSSLHGKAAPLDIIIQSPRVIHGLSELIFGAGYDFRSNVWDWNVRSESIDTNEVDPLNEGGRIEQIEGHSLGVFVRNSLRPVFDKVLFFVALHSNRDVQVRLVSENAEGVIV